MADTKDDDGWAIQAKELNIVVREYDSKSKPDVTYQVRLRAFPTRRYLTCNCPAWTRGKDQKGKADYERECRHTRDIQGYSEVNRFLAGGVDEMYDYRATKWIAPKLQGDWKTVEVKNKMLRAVTETVTPGQAVYYENAKGEKIEMLYDQRPPPPKELVIGNEAIPMLAHRSYDKDGNEVFTKPALADVLAEIRKAGVSDFNSDDEKHIELLGEVVSRYRGRTFKEAMQEFKTMWLRRSANAEMFSREVAIAEAYARRQGVKLNDVTRARLENVIRATIDEGADVEKIRAAIRDEIVAIELDGDRFDLLDFGGLDNR